MTGHLDQNIGFLKVDISDEDIMEAMKRIPGYLDITADDWKEIYSYAYNHALERITHSIKAADIMTKQVFWVRRNTTLIEIAEIMSKNGISGVPVLDQHDLVEGVISERDFLSYISGTQAKNFMGVIVECLQNKEYLAVSLMNKKAEDIMTSPAITVNENTIFGDITHIFAQRSINRLPVVDSGGKLIGIVTRGDIFRVSFKLKLI
ncbi:MAG: CBS domain-containing protein [Candidatus Tectomicrobia bacterium]|uniref:CBS domain-containing protein n=1 Tax=Tectimicrobiota bacterium TaxID=2528274 RepID=A0A933LQL1_UNCTE|nr:CBS domain-containing protein [Candidatus Tectomicrobia bacterium]